MISVDTSNILFICGGAFDGIEKDIARRLNTKPLGFTAKEEVETDLNELVNVDKQ